MHRHPWLRLLAWLVDWACVLVWVGAVAAVGVPLHLAGVTDGLGTVGLNVVGGLTVVVPVTVALTALEASTWRATPGKRTLGLRVAARDGGRASFAVCLLRNTLKVAVPWLLGHAAVFAIVAASASRSVPTGVWALTVAAYVLPIAYVIALFVGSGRTPYDVASGTSVARVG